MKKIIIVLSVFFFDRATKIYLINLQSLGIDVDFYIFPFLNFFLVWNTGIGFGIASLESNIFYHILTTIILIINLVLIFFLLRAKGVHVYLFASIVGGSFGNLFAMLIRLLSFISVITINLFFNKDLEKIILRFIIVSSVFPDFETIIKQEFFKFLILLNCKYKLASKLSKKNTLFLIFFLKKE